jgi:hypothetical protein
MEDKERCLLLLSIYHGIPPHQEHESRGSGYYYYAYVKGKFTKELIDQCEIELGH